METSSQCQVVIAAPPPTYWLEGLLGRKTGHFGEEKNLLHLLGIKLQFLCCPANSLVSILTQLGI